MYLCWLQLDQQSNTHTSWVSNLTHSLTCGGNITVHVGDQKPALLLLQTSPNLDQALQTQTEADITGGMTNCQNVRKDCFKLYLGAGVLFC